MSSGIYVIQNKKTGRVYIGQAENLIKRWKGHKYTLRRGEHYNPELQADWNRYGASNFAFKVLEHCPIDYLNVREQHFITIYTTRGLAYNRIVTIRPDAGNRFRKKPIVQVAMRSNPELMEQIRARVKRNHLILADYIERLLEVGFENDPLWGGR